MKFVIVVGRMRSGTSAVGEVLHQMGCLMGTWFTAPIPPNWRSDWEDKDLNDIVFMRAPFGTDKPAGVPNQKVYEDFSPYLEKRKAHIDTLAKVRGWRAPCYGVKQPFLLFFLPQFVEAVKRVGLEPMVIYSRRPDWQVDGSADLTTNLKKGGPESQAALTKIMDTYEPDYSVEYDALIADPDTEVRNLARVVGIDEEAYIQAGVQSVKVPTSHAVQTTGF